MLELVLLQLLDSFLLNYHAGHALVLLFGLSVLGAIPLGSRKTLALIVLAFGLLFVVTPISLLGGDPIFKFAGIALLVASPLVFTFSRD
jgi:hypothetical protein